MCTKSIYEARNNLSSLVALAESGEPVELTRYNKPVAVIISYAEYEEFNGKQNGTDNDLIFWLDKWRKEYADVLDDEGIPLPPRDEYPDPNEVIFEE